MELFEIETTSKEGKTQKVRVEHLEHGVFELTGEDGSLGVIGFHQELAGEWEYGGEALDNEEQDQAVSAIQKKGLV